MADRILVLEVGLAARTEPFVEGGGEDRRRHCFVDGGLDRPAPFARIRDPARELCERGVVGEGRGRQV